jgi:phosphatidate phosphatase APP1
VGDRNVEAASDNNPSGVAEAFRYTATASGTLTKLSIYVDGNNSANQIVVGIYTNSGSNHPGTLLTQATITNPVKPGWNTVTVPSTGVTNGTVYWIAVLGPSGGGTAQFRDTAVGGKSETSAQSNLTTLPATWTTGSAYTNAPMSAYGSQ